MVITQRAPRRDSEVDKARTMLWFYYLGTEVGSFRPRDVQRKISPLPAFDAHGGEIRNNRYLLYSRGENVPHLTFARQVGMRYPISFAILDHVLWKVLREKNPIDKKKARQWIGQLSPDIQNVVIKPDNEFKYAKQTPDMLTRRFSLDSLAALTIMFRLSREDETYKNEIQNWEHACGIFLVLMLMGQQFIHNEVRNCIFRLFTQRVFCFATGPNGLRMDLVNYDYSLKSSVLRSEASNSGIHIYAPLSRAKYRCLYQLIEIPTVLEGTADTMASDEFYAKVQQYSPLMKNLTVLAQT